MAIDEDDRQPLSDAEAMAATPPEWSVGVDLLLARYETGDFATGVRLVQRIGELADAADHHPDVDLRYPHVTVTTTSHDVGTLTARDVRLATDISQAAADLGIVASASP